MTDFRASGAPGPGWTRAWLLPVAAAAVLLGTAAVHAWRDGAASVAQSDLLLAQGKPREAVAAARRAAEDYVPFSPYPAFAYARIEAIAHASEAAGKTDDAAFAWRAMRSAAEATRPAPGSGARVDEAEAGILRLGAVSAGSAQAAAPGIVRLEIARERGKSPLWPALLAWTVLAGFLLVARYSGARPSSSDAPDAPC